MSAPRGAVLEHATGDEAQHVRAVVHHARSDLVCRVGELLEGRWEEEHRGSKQGKGGFVSRIMAAAASMSGSMRSSFHG